MLLPLRRNLCKSSRIVPTYCSKECKVWPLFFFFFHPTLHLWSRLPVVLGTQFYHWSASIFLSLPKLFFAKSRSEFQHDRIKIGSVQLLPQARQIFESICAAGISVNIKCNFKLGRTGCRGPIPSLLAFFFFTLGRSSSANGKSFRCSACDHWLDTPNGLRASAYGVDVDSRYTISLPSTDHYGATHDT